MHSPNGTPAADDNSLIGCTSHDSTDDWSQPVPISLTAGTHFAVRLRTFFYRTRFILPQCSVRQYHHPQVNSALHPPGSLNRVPASAGVKAGKSPLPAGGWQVTLCDLIWHVISRSGVVISITNCYIRFTLLYFTPIYLINLPWKLGLGLGLNLKMHYFSIFHGE